MAEIIAVANQKGGVGKTTTAVNLSAALAYLGQETLLVDLDPQGNATSGLGFDKNGGGDTAFQCLVDLVPAKKTIKATSVEMLDMIRSCQDMVSAELELAKAISRENRLKNALAPFSKTYRFIIIDCPPSLGLLTVNALVASSKVLIPLQGEYYALEGLAAFMDAVRRIQGQMNPELHLEGGVLTMFDPRFSLAQQVKSELVKFFRESLYKTHIPRSVRLAEAPSFGKTIFQYDPKSRGSQAYLSLAGEMLARRGWKGMRLEGRPQEKQ
ncbi:ParA family protein [Elusimicrobiota bacterium]